MASSKSRLGKGLSGILSASQQRAPSPQASAPRGGAAKTEARPTAATPSAPDLQPYRDIPVKSIVPNPRQPRREISQPAIEELAASIRSEGLLQPVVVRETDKGFELIAGERRWRACQHLKLEKIPARVLPVNDATSATLALVENLQRENLNPIEEAQGYSMLIKDFGFTQEDAARRVGKGRATVANALRLLSLGRELQGYLASGRLSTGHAKVLLGVADESQRQLLGRRIITDQLNVRDTEKLVRKLTQGVSRRGGSSGSHSDSDIKAAVAELERKLGRRLGTTVQVRHSGSRGKIVVDFNSMDELSRLCDLITG